MPRRNLALPPIAALALVSCGPTTRPASTPPPPRAGGPAAGLDRVMDHDAPALSALFGTAVLDVREGPARKLQYRSAVCVLDAYLYPSPGAAGPGRVTWIDARTPAGAEFDRASCIAALARAEPARSHGRP